ncbi:D-erythronate dehydrogenase [Acinetobacter baumannii]|uniref:D-erythronate dehydrogenase n=1 Tax=Acinetobacter baumannii TaxID=470 RepID=UPI0002B9A656|nr:D-erythronate dehydrogenase [Acinetobacter baumannii]CAH1087516.1 UDP-glucose 4-epimerase [Acinetobacter phage MD-2021a]ARG36891.1 NAD-dependent epimerase [Acinetobacter baumannii]AVN29822.1 KR domain-containing protein [Acinetobacter baumannii]EKU1553459.1 NAD-dependent epimerase/dehydratase family protein [Acinetobacter baumannii]EKU2692583.1 NAD-dependent epimerase/dehydratase family protein [Acinetobacter baumannii]
MNVLITGGTGFIGKQIAKEILKTGSLTLDGKQAKPIDKIILFDAFAGDDLQQDPKIEVVIGDITDKTTVANITEKIDVVWHLAAVVSSAAEADFDLGMDVNLYGLLNLLEELRKKQTTPRVIFASGCAVFGGQLPEVVTDDTVVTPKSSYGMQKAVGELLVSDYSRKGFIDGRVLRLPTIVVRPGKPNKAASTFFSSIIREPLKGETAVCPVPPDTPVFITSPRRCVESMIKAASISSDALQDNRIIPLPGLTVTVKQMLEALEKVAGKQATDLVQWQEDKTIQRIVQSWPVQVKAEYAESLGFQADENFESIIQAHIEDTQN